MATTFRNKVVTGIGTSYEEVLATNDNNRITVVGFSINVQLRDADSSTGYYAKEMILPPNTSLRVLNGGEKLILTPNNNLYVSSNVADSIDCILSTVEIV